MTARTEPDATPDAPTSPQEIVGAIYEAFGRGDVPAVLEHLAPDVAWDIWPDNFGQRADLPHLRPRRGREEVGEFFAVVAEQTLYDFTVQDLVADRNTVIAVPASTSGSRTAAGTRTRSCTCGRSERTASCTLSGTTSTPPSTSRPSAGKTPRRP
jgi:ketosteroid isomerase-like protein